MSKSLKLFVLAGITAFAAAMLAASALGNAIVAAPAGTTTFTSLGKLTFTGRGAVEFSVSCRVTLRGTLSPGVIEDASGGRFGSITEARANECTSGTALLLVESRSSWGLTLAEASRLEGRPKKMVINLNRAKWQVEGIGGQTCLYEGTFGTTLESEGSSEELATRLLRINTNNERIFRNSGFCPERGEIRGEFEITRQTLRLSIGTQYTEEETSREDTRGRIIRNITSTYPAGAVGNQNITALSTVPTWTIGAELNCVRVFTPGTSCAITATSEVNSRLEFKVFLEAGTARNIVPLIP